MILGAVADIFGNCTVLDAGLAPTVLLLLGSRVARVDRGGDRVGAILDRLLGNGLDDGLANEVAGTRPREVAHVAKGGALRRSVERTGGSHCLEVAGGLVTVVNRGLGGEDIFAARNDCSGAQWTLRLCTRKMMVRLGR